MRDHDAYTQPNAKKAPIGLTWRNSTGRRPQSAQTVERNRRVAIIAQTLASKPNMTAVDVVLGFRAVGIEFTLKTAARYLALARGEK